MCSHCSKLCCLACIEQWLATPNSGKRCPHCQGSLASAGQLIKFRWADDVTRHFETTPPPPDEQHHDVHKCSKHAGEKIDIFCLDCRTSICHRCALFGSAHFAHTFLALDEVCESHKASMKQSVAKALARHTRLVARLLDARHALDEFHTAKKRRYKQLNMFDYLHELATDKLAPCSSVTFREEQYLTNRVAELNVKLHELKAAIEHAEREHSG